MKEKKVIDYTIEADKKKCILYIVILLLLGFLLMWTQIDDLTRWILFYKRTPKENKCQSQKCPLAQILLILGKLLSMIIYKKISQKGKEICQCRKF